MVAKVANLICHYLVINGCGLRWFQGWQSKSLAFGDRKGLVCKVFMWGISCWQLTCDHFRNKKMLVAVAYFPM